MTTEAGTTRKPTGPEEDGIDRMKPLGAYTDEEMAVLPHTFAHKKVGCDKPGPGCIGYCIATCENLANLRLTTIHLHEEIARLKEAAAVENLKDEAPREARAWTVGSEREQLAQRLAAQLPGVGEGFVHQFLCEALATLAEVRREKEALCVLEAELARVRQERIRTLDALDDMTRLRDRALLDRVAADSRAERVAEALRQIVAALASGAQAAQCLEPPDPACWYCGDIGCSECRPEWFMPQEDFEEGDEG